MQDDKRADCLTLINTVSVNLGLKLLFGLFLRGEMKKMFVEWFRLVLLFDFLFWLLFFSTDRTKNRESIEDDNRNSY